MKIVPVFGNGIAGKSFNVTRERRLNCYIENRPDGDKSKAIVYGTPGLVYAFNTGYAQVTRGMIGTQNNLFVVTGNYVQKWNANGTLNSQIVIGSSSGFVSMAYSPTQLVIVDGSSGYVVQLSNLSYQLITAAGFPNGCKTVTFSGGYFVVENPNTQQFFVSGLFDATTWSALSFASASQYSDNLVAVDQLVGNLVLYSNRHQEFWQNVGSTPQPYAPILSATNEYGLAAIYSRAHVNGTICFLAQSPQGIAQICQNNGYNVTVISTPDLDYIISQFQTYADAVALSYMTDGHAMYQITFPTANSSFIWDASTTVWSEVQTGVSKGWAARHQGQFSAYAGGATYISDYQNGNIYTLSSTAYTDNGAIIPREITTRHALDNHNRFTVDEIYLDMEMGVGLTAGQGSNPLIMLEVSQDNGHTFSTPRNLTIGQLGKYKNRIIARRFGTARDFVFRFRMTDPVKFVITGGAMSVREERQP